MIDLHLHLDGSLSPEFVIRRCKEEGIAFDPQNLRLSVPEDCTSLVEYLECFSLPLLVLQTREGLRAAVMDLLERLTFQGLLYVEIRFAPCQHCMRGMSQRDAVEAALEGLGEETRKGSIKAQLILCCMRGGSEAENLETVEVAKEFLGRGVAALDVAGDEAGYPIGLFQQLLARAQAQGVPYTLHAGEAEGPQSIREALRLGTQRIGHGVRAQEDSALVTELARIKIPLELCPTSNLQTKAVPSWEAYPLREYLRQGLRVTLNTDNMTVSGTTLAQEYQFLREHCGLTPQEERQLLHNSCEAAFLSPQEKEALARAVEEQIR